MAQVYLTTRSPEAASPHGCPGTVCPEAEGEALPEGEATEQGFFEFVWASRARLDQIAPALMALGQMRMRALEHYAFEISETRDTVLKRESTVEEKKAYLEGLMGSINTACDELEAALRSGRVTTLAQAFAEFENYTTITQLDNFMAHETPWYMAPIKWYFKDKSRGPMNEVALRNLLVSGDVEVESLLGLSELTDPLARGRWLLDYTKELRTTPYASGRGYPARTVATNLQSLTYSSDPAIGAQAEELLGQVSGETALTGMSDEEWAQLLYEGSKATVPMVAAMMVAGPLGAYAEGTVAATRVHAGGRILWQGSQAGKAGLTARGIGFTITAPSFWALNDSFHATTLGGGDYYTPEGLASAFLMLGGLRLLGGAWQGMAGQYLTRAATRAPERALAYSVANHSGAFTTEWAGFWGIGQFEEWAEIIPTRETELRQEFTEAGVSLVQLRGAVAAGHSVPLGGPDPRYRVNRRTTRHFREGSFASEELDWRRAQEQMPLQEERPDLKEARPLRGQERQLVLEAEYAVDTLLRSFGFKPRPLDLSQVSIKKLPPPKEARGEVTRSDKVILSEPNLNDPLRALFIHDAIHELLHFKSAGGAVYGRASGFERRGFHVNSEVFPHTYRGPRYQGQWPGYKPGGQKAYFRALNEAITEALTLEVLDSISPELRDRVSADAYTLERGTLEMIIEGIAQAQGRAYRDVFMDFARAYFSGDFSGIKGPIIETYGSEVWRMIAEWRPEHKCLEDPARLQRIIRARQNPGSTPTSKE